MIQHKGEFVNCPHCGEEQEGTVEDFVVPGKSGYASECEDQCWSCDEFFIVSYFVEDDEYEVRKSGEAGLYCNDLEDMDEEDDSI